MQLSGSVTAYASIPCAGTRSIFGSYSLPAYRTKARQIPSHLNCGAPQTSNRDVCATRHISKQHLHRYLAEFDFRYNTRDVSDIERAEQAIQGVKGKRLRYN